MKTLRDLSERIRRLDGRGYKAYRSLEGTYQTDRFTLRIDRAQGDPFAEPSRLRATVGPAEAQLPDWAYSTRLRRTATADFINRIFHVALERRSRSRGSGRSGELRILRPGQQVLERTSLLVGADGTVEARFRAGLPARGRRIDARAAEELLTLDVIAAIHEALLAETLPIDALQQHVETVEDAAALRAELEPRGLVAFIADGAILPRRSGVDDRPLPTDRARPFRAPEELRVTITTPNAGPITGMGIPEGVTLIVGGGYHGKSTLLRAI